MLNIFHYSEQTTKHETHGDGKHTHTPVEEQRRARSPHKRDPAALKHWTGTIGRRCMKLLTVDRNTAFRLC